MAKENMQQPNSNNLADQQLIDLRARLRDIRTAKYWLQEYRVNAREHESRALTGFYMWLDQQEAKTIAMGRRIKEQSQ